jgi:coenzyme Q-binding protein COQ10
MTSIRRRLVLPYRPLDLYDLVADIGCYPDFIQWIRRMTIFDSVREGAVWKARAETEVGFLTFRERFTSEIVGHRDKLTIDVAQVRGPFRRLRNAWRFAEAPGGTDVDFYIEFEFRNFILQALADTNRDLAVNGVIDSFVKEAARRYRKADTLQSQPAV